MKTIPQRFEYLSIFLFLLVLFSCNKDDGSTMEIENEETAIEQTDSDEIDSDETLLETNTIELPNTIIDVIETNEDLSLFKEAIIKAGLEGDFNAEGPLTLFAPTNTAIQELFILLGEDYNSFDDFNDFVELEILKRILLYHGLDKQLNLDDFSPQLEATLLDGDSLEIIDYGFTFVIGDASEVDANLLVTDENTNNGVVHIIDKILIPAEVQELIDSQNVTTNAVIEEVLEQENYSLLKEALSITDLLNTLDNDDMELLLTLANDSFNTLFTLLSNTYFSLDEFDTNSEILELRNVILLYLSSIRAN